jgi:hypothetical protein
MDSSVLLLSLDGDEDEVSLEDGMGKKGEEKNKAETKTKPLWRGSFSSPDPNPEPVRPPPLAKKLLTDF